MQQGHKPERSLGQSFLYRSTIRVNVFGRERDKDGVVIYYWVVDGTGGRFKATPNELT